MPDVSPLAYNATLCYLVTLGLLGFSMNAAILVLFYAKKQVSQSSTLNEHQLCMLELYGRVFL